MGASLNWPAAPERLTKRAHRSCPSVLAGDLPPTGKRAFTRPVGQRPVPGLLLTVPARTTDPMLAFTQHRPTRRRTPDASTAIFPIGAERPGRSRLRLAFDRRTVADLTHRASRRRR